MNNSSGIEARKLIYIYCTLFLVKKGTIVAGFLQELQFVFCGFSGSSRRSSIASLKALKEDANSRRRRQSSEYPPSEQSLSRSKSLLDLRSNFEPTPLRRSHSSVSLHQRNSGRDSGYADRITYSDDAASSRSGMPSPAQSEWSIRTAPQMATYDMDYIDQRPASVASLPVRGRRGNLRRTRSQPNLTNTLTKTGTYPQGILKRGNTAAKDERPVARHNNSSYLGDRGYGEVGMMQDPREYQQVCTTYFIEKWLLYKIHICLLPLVTAITAKNVQICLPSLRGSFCKELS